MPRHIGNTLRNRDRLDDAIDSRRTISGELLPGYLRLAYDELRTFLTDFIHCEDGLFWSDARVGRHDCEFEYRGQKRHAMLTFDPSEPSPNKFVLKAAWFDTDGKRGIAVRLDGDKLRHAFTGWLRSRGRTAGPTTTFDLKPDRSNRNLAGGLGGRPVCKLKGGLG